MNTRLIFRNIKLIDCKSELNNKRVNVKVDQNKAWIVPSDEIEAGFEEHDAGSMILTQGFTDLYCHIPDPGFEYRENFESASRLALASGYTTLCCLPDSDPVVDTKSQVHYILQQNEQSPVTFLPVGALTQKLQGKSMADLFDMHTHGAVAFSDANHPVMDVGLLKRSLQYVSGFGGVVFTYALDPQFNEGGLIHEGLQSLLLGLKGLPPQSEYLMIQRNIEVLDYVGGKLHISKVSCAESVALIRAAKQRGLAITADVAALNLLATDIDLDSFSSHYKVLPPLRDTEHQLALIEGIKDGTIDAICSDHRPLNPELKQVEFNNAAFGASTLQSVWVKLLEKWEHTLGFNLIASCLSYGPQKVLQIEPKPLTLGEIRNFVITQLQKPWTLTPHNNASLSANTPFMHTRHAHQIVATHTSKEIYFNNL